MVINTHMTGAGGTPLANSTDQTGSKSKTARPAGNPSSVAGAAVLDSQVSRIFASGGSEIMGSEAAGMCVQQAKAGIHNNPAAAMLAQANLSPEMVMNLLQP